MICIFTDSESNKNTFVSIFIKKCLSFETCLVCYEVYNEVMNKEAKSNQTLLSKDNSAALHGVAILMMIYHHLFITGNTWYNDKPWSLFDFFDAFALGQAETFQLTFAWFCKICVAIFAFTSGYAMYVQFKKKYGEDAGFRSMYSYCLKRLWSFYKKFLLCFLFFITYDYLAGNQNGFDYSLGNYLLNLLGIRATFNSTWWYILIYYYMILISPIVYSLLNRFKFKHYLIIAAAFLISFVVAFASGHLIDYIKFLSRTVQQYQIIYLIIFMEGMFCGRYPILEMVSSKMNRLTSLAALVVVFVARALLIRAPSDSFFDIIFIAPLIVCFVKLLNLSDKIKTFFRYFGKYSSYMWYTHAYFYSYLFFDLVFRCDLSLLVYLQVVLYSLASSIVFTLLENWISNRFKTSKENR